MKSPFKINHLAVWLLALVDQGLSMAWFGVFSRQWVSYLNKPMEELQNNNTPMPYVMGFVTAIVLNYTLAWTFLKFHVTTVSDGLIGAVILWLGFFFLPVLTNYLFSMRPAPLAFIDGGNYLLYFIVGGVVLSGWRKTNKA